MSFREYAIKVLEESDEPLKIPEITRRALKMGLKTTGKTPAQTMRGIIAESISKDANTPLVKHKSGKYSLK
jgi:predicted Zn-ribbon and HTH transcriptional regulator